MTLIEQIDRLIADSNKVVDDPVHQAWLDGIIDGLETVRNLIVSPDPLPGGACTCPRAVGAPLQERTTDG